ncbi:MAG: T9SS type A sorting domain-containing protein [Ferruginibacter sp.]
MKKSLLLFLLFTSRMFLVNAQITVPIVKANFGVEADLSSNYFNNAIQPAVDDWFGRGYSGTGQSIIDSTGAATIIAGYAISAANRSRSFSKLMKPAPYSVVNNRLVLDAIFHRDFHGDDSTVFASGSNKNGMSPASWSCPVSQGIPDKNDILDAYTHVRRAGPNVTDSLWMFSAIAIENTTGSRYFDFELYQTDFYYDRVTRTFNNYGPDAGHTSWKFDAAGKIISPGDIVFTAEFGSASITLVQARIWINKNALSISPFSFNWGGQFDGDGSSATFGYANILPKTAGAFYTGIQSTVASTWAGPFGVIREDNSYVANFIPKQFMEFAVNLTLLGIDPANFSNNPCGTPFRRVMIKTRASTSFTAELKDFVAPFRLFDYAKVDADAFIQYHCVVMPTTSINVVNPLSTSLYTWSTVNGNILGSTTGTSISVNAPGTYYVTQKLHTACPVTSMDSVTLFFDSICTILQVDISNFNVYTKHGNAELNWKVNNNELVKEFVPEYSLDNVHYFPLSTLSADSRSGSAAYSFTNSQNLLSSSPIIYYRVKMLCKDNVIKISETVLQHRSETVIPKVIVFPNPVTSEAYILLDDAGTRNVTISIIDSYGRILQVISRALNKGKNILLFDELAKQKPNFYIIKIETGKNQTTHKVIVSK